MSTYTEDELEWVLWMEPDAIFDDPSLTIPFEFYQGMDIITVADPKKADLGDPEGKRSAFISMFNSP